MRIDISESSDCTKRVSDTLLHQTLLSAEEVLLSVPNPQTLGVERNTKCSHWHSNKHDTKNFIMHYLQLVCTLVGFITKKQMNKYDEICDSAFWNESGPIS